MLVSALKEKAEKCARLASVIRSRGCTYAIQFFARSMADDAWCADLAVQLVSEGVLEWMPSTVGLAVQGCKLVFARRAVDAGAPASPEALQQLAKAESS